MKANTVLDTIGRTPHVKINKLFGNKHQVWMKLERANPGGSIKDRIALAMIEDAEEKGLLRPDTTIIEPTSGNTGIGLALVAAVKDYRLVLVMPESMSLERRRYMQALGAELELTPREQGMPGAISRAKALSEQIPNSWMPCQFENPANVTIHSMTTAQEIIGDFDGEIDCLIGGVGTGGHITGVAQEIKKLNPSCLVYGVEPELSPVLSGGQAQPHSLQGIGAGFIPSILKVELLDGILKVKEDAAFRYANRCAKEEGIFVGISTGAVLAATAELLSTTNTDLTVLLFCYDSGERYLSVENLF